MMRIDPPIKSLLETDMYKFSMGQVIFHQFPEYKVTWTFKCRNENIRFTPEMVEEIHEQIKHFCSLRFRKDELDFLRKIKWMKEGYINFLERWFPLYDDFVIRWVPYGCGLEIEATGLWLNTSMYEIPTLAIVSEVYSRMAYDYDKVIKLYTKSLDEKIRWLSWYDGRYSISKFSNFGLRRRLSAEAEDLAIDRLLNTKYKNSQFVGTSNVYHAYIYGCTPTGTQAHEYTMCVGQGNPAWNPAYSNRFAMEAWVGEYKTMNGIALSDTIGTPVFLRDFDHVYATLYKGVRHDSGDPVKWGEMLINHYKKLDIDPRTKTLLFSDSLDFEKADILYRYFNGRADVAFGIGTFITNMKLVTEDCKVEPPNIVMKVTKCNGYDVAKLSDVEGKGMCKSQEYVDYLRRSINYRMIHEKEMA